jgi:uncharacterized membrane protein YqjE
MADANPEAGHAAGLLTSLKSLLSTLLSIAHTRLELISTELEEERARLQEFLALMLVSVFCLGFGFLLLTFFIVAVFWDTYRLSVLGGLAVFYLGSGITAAVALRRKIRSKPRLLAATLAELSKDRDSLNAQR